MAKKKGGVSLCFFFFLSFCPCRASLELPPVLGEPTVFTASTRMSLYAIGKKFSVGVHHLKIANGLKRSSVQAGETLVVPKFRIAPYAHFDGLVLNLPERTLYFYRNNKVIDFYPVAVGRPSMPTPAGKFKIVSRIRHPTWMPPAWAGIDHPVPPGPGNPLGDFWLGTSKRGVGLHSTNAPASIGWTVSHGCVRMYPWNVKALFEKVRVGDPIAFINEPLKIGQKDGLIFLEVHPWLYHRINYEETLKKKAKKAGILELIDWNKARKIIREKRGYAVPFIGEKVLIQNVKGERKEGVLMRKRGSLLADLSLFLWATQIESFELSQDSMLLASEKGTVEIHKSQNVLLLDGGVTSVPLVSSGNQLFVPVRLLSEALSFIVTYRPQEQLLLFSSTPLLDKSL